jgi:hypothetical protein
LASSLIASFIVPSVGLYASGVRTFFALPGRQADERQKEKSEVDQEVNNALNLIGEGVGARPSLDIGMALAEQNRCSPFGERVSRCA